MKTNAERCREWREKNPEKARELARKYLHSEKGQAATKRSNNKQTAETIRRNALDAAKRGAGGSADRLNKQIRDLYQRGKTPATIVIRLNIPMSRVMAAIQNA